jgi:hypothetical protein
MQDLQGQQVRVRLIAFLLIRTPLNCLRMVMSSNRRQDPIPVLGQCIIRGEKRKTNLTGNGNINIAKEKKAKDNTIVADSVLSAAPSPTNCSTSDRLSYHLMSPTRIPRPAPPSFVFRGRLPR